MPKIDQYRLYERMDACGIKSQSKLAEVSGVCRQTISRSMSTKIYYRISIKAITAIARALACTPEYLMNDHRYWGDEK